MCKTANKTATMAAQQLDQLLAQIALDHLFIETLATRNSDSLDFHDVSVWGVKSALQAAFDAGLRAAGGAPKQPVHRSRKASGALSANGTATAFQA